VTAGIGGLINRRVQVDANVGAFFGNVGFSGGLNAFDTYTAGASAVYGISRGMGVRVTYSYFYYSYEQGALPLVNLLVPTSDRHSIQANFVVWEPLFYRRRKANATR